MTNFFEIPTVDQAKVEEFFAPYKALNALALANAEKLITLQASNFVKYSNIALNSVKEAGEISDLAASKAYFEKQSEVAKQVAADVQADVQVVAELNKAYFDEVKSVYEANVEKAVEAAQNVEPLTVVKAKAPAKRAAKKAAA